MRFPLSILAIAALGHVTAVAAPTHVFDFTFDGSSTTTNLSAAGQQLMDGETVGLTLRAASNDHFEANGSYVWVPLAMGECGTRIGDLSYSFWLDGVELASGSYAAHGHSCVHIANSMALPSMLAFDELRWAFLQLSPTTATNTLGNLLSPPPATPRAIPCPRDRTSARLAAT